MTLLNAFATSRKAMESSKLPSFGTECSWAPRDNGTETTTLNSVLTCVSLATRQASKKKRQVIFKRAESYIKEYRSKEREEIRLKREAKSQGNFFVPEEHKLAFVVRLKGINKMHPKPRKTLQIMRLLQINNGVFIKINKATLKQLVLIEPFIAWGLVLERSCLAF
jgi:60S ribosomal protein uL30